jgi:hypothetical protein
MLSKETGPITKKRTHAKVLHGLTTIPHTAEEDSVGASWCTHGELIEGESLTTSVEDALLGSTGEPQGGDREFWDFESSDVIGNSANDDDDFRVTLWGFFGVLDDFRERDRGLVDFGEEKAVEDGL